MRLTSILAGAAFAAMTQVAWSADPDWLPSPLPKPLSEITVGFSNLGTGVNAYSATYTEAFNSYAAELGIKTIVLDSQADPVKQSAQIQTLVSQKPDVLIVWPVNAKAVVPALKQASEAGIPVVVTNSQADASGDAYVTAFTGPNDYTQAEMAAKSLAEALGGKGSIVELNGMPGYSAGEQRLQAFKDVLAKYPDIKVLDSQPANWSQEKGQSLMENYITRFGNDIQGVLSASGDMGLGALTAVKAAIAEGRLAKAPVFSDPTMTGGVYDAIKAGEYYSSVLQSPQIDARTALKAALQIAEGVKLPAVVFMETPGITKDNITTVDRPTF